MKNKRFDAMGDGVTLGRLALLGGAFYALLLGACTTLSPTTPYDASVSKAYVREAPERLEPTAEDAMQTSDLSLAEHLALEDCIAWALAHNPELLAVDADRDAAEADLRISRAPRLPNVQLTGSYNRHLENQRLGMPTGGGQAIFYTRDIVSADVVLRLPLYAGGRLVNEFKASQLMAVAAERQLAQTQKELVFNVTSLYYSLLAQQQVVASTRFSRETMTAHLERTQQLVAAEKAARVDVLRTEVRLADIQQRLLQEENNLAITYRILANQLGLEIPEPTTLSLADSLEEDAPEEVITGAALLEDALTVAYQQRDDLAAAVAALEAQARRVDVARGQREPNLSFEAMYGGRWAIGGSGVQSGQSSRALSWTPGNPGSLSLNTTTPLAGGATLNSTLGPGGSNFRLSRAETQSADNFREVGSIGLRFDIPVFEGGRIRAQISKEESRLQAAQQRLRRLELQVRLEVESAVLNLESARERVTVTRKSIREAEESLRIETLKYEQGKGMIVDVLDAQAALLAMQTSYYRALADVHTARAELRLARGDSLT